ncbi:MAG: 2-oxo acid dehydrogenase subunit E2 [Oscillospiraceae bacterium]|jgi:pyruvate/2-oxoglutarate dehydrogenase complex dihydrolipoamide acyltransferase (E2) component|nr:2-oxo acid dehydrogenase subunit E2 [Oscillospiraceae bacterium]
MAFSKRHDATRVKTAYDFNAIFPYLMKRRSDSIVFFTELVETEPLLAYVREKKASGNPMTSFQVILAAIIRTLHERPELNRYIIGRRIYQRKAVDVSFVAKRTMTDKGEETVVNIHSDSADSYQEILSKISGSVKEVKRGKVKEDDKLISALMHFPRFVLRAVVRTIELFDFYVDTPKFLRGVDPLRCSAFVANLGSVGIEAPFHHLYEWGTCSMFVALGKNKPTPYVAADGSIAAKKMIEIKVSLDERIADGFYCARSLALFKHYITHPHLLEGETAEIEAGEDDE